VLEPKREIVEIETPKPHRNITEDITSSIDDAESIGSSDDYGTEY
jgi:hypothetical protein